MKQRRILVNKKLAGSCCVGKLLGLSQASVQNYLKRAKCKSFVQKMTPRHMEQRVECAKWALENYGVRLDGRTI